jgi:galactokinase
MPAAKSDPTRIETLAAALDAAFGRQDDPSPLEIVRAPGRLNLIGDFMEFNEAFALPAAIGLETWLAYRRRSDGVVRVVSRQSSETGSFDIDSIPTGIPRDAAGRGRRHARIDAADHATHAPAHAAAWTEHVVGAAWSLREAGIGIGGFDGVVDTTLPVGGGLGSSAALELASTLALIGRGRVLSPAHLASLAQRAERDYVGVDAGILDMLAGAAGRADRALLLDYRSLEVRPVAMPFGVEVVLCDTGERHGTPAKYRAECARAVALLAEKMPGLCSLRDLDAASLRRYRDVLPESVAARAEYVVSENARVVATAAALETGDLDELGRLFAESHAALRDLYLTSSPAVEAMVDVVAAIPGVIGSRMMATGSGGYTVNLVLADAVPAVQTAAAREYGARTGLRGRAFQVDLVDGAGSISPP